MFIRICAPCVTRTYECSTYQTEVVVGGIRVTAALHGNDVLDTLLGADFTKMYVMSEHGTTIDTVSWVTPPLQSAS